MPGPSRHPTPSKQTPKPSKLAEQDITGLYDLIKGDRNAQAEVWTALEDFRNGDLSACRAHLDAVFSRVGVSLRETAQDTVEERAKRIIDKIAADQGKSYKRVATRELVARTKVKAEQQVEKARKIVAAFESVLSRLPSSATARPVADKAAVTAEPSAAAEQRSAAAEEPSAAAEEPSGAAEQPTAATPVGSQTDVTPTPLPRRIDPLSTSESRDVAVSSEVRRAFKHASTAQAARKVLRQSFLLQQVDDQSLIEPGAVIHLHGGTRGNLVRVTSIEHGEVRLEKPHNGRPYQALVPLAYFVSTGSQGKTFLLLPKQQNRERPDRTGEHRGNLRDDQEVSLVAGRQDAAVTRASFQLLISDIGRAKQKLQVFSDLHKVRVGLNIDTRSISDADRGSFRKGDKVKARQQAEIIKSQVHTAVNSARSSVQKREQEFRQTKEKVAGSERRPMESCFAPTYLALHAVEKAMRNLVQGLDAALSLDTDDTGQTG